MKRVWPVARILVWYAAAWMITRWTGSDALVWIIGATLGGRQIQAEVRKRQLRVRGY